MVTINEENGLEPVAEDMSIFILGGRIKSDESGYAAHGQFSPTQRSPIIEQAQDAERLGFRRAWLSERFNLKESGVVLGAAAAVTSRIMLGTGALAASSRPPIVIAAIGATMQAAFGSRYILGLGRGHPALYAGHGFPEDGCVSYESLIDRADIIRRLWRGETINYAGPAGKYENLKMVDIPDTPPEIWFVSFGGPKACKAAANPVFDGHMLADLLNPTATRKTVTDCRIECERIGRDPESLRICVPVVTAPNVSSDEEVRSLVHARVVGILEMKGAGEIFCRQNEWDEKVMHQIRNHPKFKNMPMATADLSFHRSELLEVTRLLPESVRLSSALPHCRNFGMQGPTKLLSTVVLQFKTPELSAPGEIDPMPELMRLPSSASDALQRAAAEAGLDDFGDVRFMDGLERYLSSLRTEANLSEFGQAIVAVDINQLLVNRLRFESDLKNHPEILDEQISDVLVITGLPRSGTTKLHQLIARDPAVLKLPYWRIVNIAPLPDAAADVSDPRIALAESYVEAQSRLSPEIMRAHPPQAEEPEEDIFIMRMTFESQANGFFDYVPSYLSWLEAQPTGYSYHYLYRLLQYTQWQQGGGNGRPWVLKSPLHGSQMDVILDTFSKVRFVHCHRDPMVTIASMLVLYEAMWSSRGSKYEPNKFSVALLRRWAEEIAASMRLRKEQRDRLRILDLKYDDIVGNSRSTAHRVYEFWNHRLTAEAEHGMAEWEATNPQHKFGKHQYSLEQYGLVPADVSKAFGEYIAKYGTPI